MLSSCRRRRTRSPWLASSPWAQSRVRRSSAFLHTAASSETVTIPCRSNGSVSLSIHHPLVASPAASASPAVLIHLPRGPLLHHPEHDAANVSALRSVLSHHLVQIHYRASRDDQFPTPIHDVLAGYDWVLEHLLPKRAISRVGRSTHVGRVAVCGELMGGGLAAMLALTECRSGQVGVVCAGLNAPVVDWVDLDELLDAGAPTQHSKNSVQEHAPQDTGLTGELLQLRKQLFRKPEHFFDPFASPLLFFRSTGKAVPSPIPEKKPPRDEFGILAMLNEENYYREQHALSRIGDNSSPSSSSPSSSEDGLVPRRASRRFPGKSSGLKLPAFHVSAGESLPIKEQGAELIYRVRQSLTRQQKASSGTKVLTDDEEEAMKVLEKKSQMHVALDRGMESKAKFTLNKGTALWDGTQHGRAHMLQMAHWLKEQLG